MIKCQFVAWSIKELRGIRPFIYTNEWLDFDLFGHGKMCENVGNWEISQENCVIKSMTVRLLHLCLKMKWKKCYNTLTLSLFCNRVKCIFALAHTAWKCENMKTSTHILIVGLHSMKNIINTEIVECEKTYSHETNPKPPKTLLNSDFFLAINSLVADWEYPERRQAVEMKVKT